MIKLCSHPLFWIGLAIRLALMFTPGFHAVNNWYVPFLHASTAQITFDPWTTWINRGGAAVAFPYGYAMWFSFLPLTLIAKLFGISSRYSYELTLLTADFALLVGLRQFLPGRDPLLIGVYWLSPIVILATYGLGLNDLIPVLFLTLSLYFTQQFRFKYAGIACAAAISAKLSMVLALPFFLIYLFNNHSLKQFLAQFLRGFLIGGATLGLPFFFSAGGLHMLVSNPEMGKIYNLTLNLGNNVALYVIPLIYFVMLYIVWRIRRLNYDLFHAILGIIFLLIVLMMPASPGWFIWTIPFLVTYQAMSGRLSIVLTGIFSCFYVVSSLLTTPLLEILSFGHFNINSLSYFSKELNTHIATLLHTGMVATGLILGMRIWRETVSRNDYFRLSRNPFVIGIAGDSGAGKDTFSDALTGLFGNQSVTTLSGDDYHLWDRQKPMWQVMTHLNPMANDLEGFAIDLLSLVDRKNIQSRHYDHATGKMSKPFIIKSNDFIISSGLHALYLPILRNSYHLSIYLDIDENLRRLFKIQRDVHQRGKTVEDVLSSFDRRELDSARFIRPQAEHADLILSLQPLHPIAIPVPTDMKNFRFKLIARTRHGLNEFLLLRVLIGVCGLHVDLDDKHDHVSTEVILTIEGDTSAEDIAIAAKILCPRILPFLGILPKWQDGIVGIMQLITLTQINQTLTKRLV